MRKLWTIVCFVLVCFTVDPLAAGQEDSRLDRLFQRLGETEDSAEGQSISTRIWQIWMESEDEKVSALMAEGVLLMQTGRLGGALERFDEMVAHDPGFAEGWNKRATVHYLMGNYDASIRDVEKTLTLEPRHFGALSGLGLIYVAIGRDDVALRAFEAAIEVNPHLDGVRKNIEIVKKRLLGDAI